MNGLNKVIIHRANIDEDAMSRSAKKMQPRVNMNYHEIAERGLCTPANDNRGPGAARFKKIMMILVPALLVLAAIMFA